MMFPPSLQASIDTAGPKALPVTRFIHGVDRAGPVRLVRISDGISITFAKFIGRENGAIVHVAPVAQPPVPIIPATAILAIAKQA